MTDRINSLTVVLKHDIREDDIEPLVKAIELFSGIVSVDLNVTDAKTHVASMRAKSELKQKLLDIFG